MIHVQAHHPKHSQKAGPQRIPPLCSLTVISNTLEAAANLAFVDLRNNNLWGNLSQGCGLTRSGFMEQISLSGNALNGSIPACILGLKNLVELRLDNNALAGVVPAIAGAKSSKLVHFIAANQVRLLRNNTCSWEVNGRVPTWKPFGGIPSQKNSPKKAPLRPPFSLNVYKYN